MSTADAVFSTHDRMGLSVFGALLVHMVIILGIVFTVPKLRAIQGLPTLEITLVQTRSNQAPEKAEFLAQTNQDGGGDTHDGDMARNPLPVPEISEYTKDFPTAPSVPRKRLKATREVTDLLSQTADTRKIKLNTPKEEITEPEVRPRKVGFFEQTNPQEERARLSAEISRFWQDYQSRPKHKFLNARTQKYIYAAYMAAWRAKVERIGNLNYPEQARRQRVSGKLMLDVALNPNGSIHEVTVLRSSGYKILDDAAVRIVKLGAPYAPFPPNIRTETDVLHITRTWQFNKTNLR